MKSLSAYKLSMGALACAFLVACNTGEEDVVPQMNKSKATPSAQAPKKADAPAEEEPELVPLKSLSGDKTAEAPAEVAAPAPAKAAPFVSGSVQPQQDGQYVIQVGRTGRYILPRPRRLLLLHRRRPDLRQGSHWRLELRLVG